MTSVNNDLVVAGVKVISFLLMALASGLSVLVKTLRVFVESGGCSGMQYGMVFDEVRPDDTSAQFFGVSLLVDPFSAEYLRGTVVDYVDALTGGGFKILNPKAKQSCGCGKSFEA